MATMSDDGDGARREALATCLRSDAIGLVARRALSEMGIRHIVLKGRGFARLLYDADWERAYRDTDLLVSPRDVVRAGAALRAACFARPGADYLDLPPHYSQFWVHQGTGGAVDLHWSVPGPAATPEVVWGELSARTRTLEIADAPAVVLDPTASAFLSALHAARHGPRFPRPIADLERALDRLPDDAWTGAVGLARRLGAEAAFGAGLSLLPAGRALLERHGVLSDPTMEMWLKEQHDPRLWSALFVDSILNAGGMRAAGHELVRWAFPPAPAMRARHRLARRGPRGLVTAYAVRCASLPGRVPGAIFSWVVARRSMLRDSSRGR